jgi:hypothetical protein
MGRDDGVQAVRTYLAAEFIGATVEDFFTGERQARHFLVVRGTESYQAIVSFEFLDNTALERIPGILRCWGLSAQMRAAGARGVMVTEGISPL